MELIFQLDKPFLFQVPVVTIILGIVVGLSYGLLAVGLILIYRSSRVINLAHGELGAACAAVVALLVNNYGLPYWLAALCGIALGAVLGGLVEVTVIRRLSKSPRFLLLVATLGVAQLFLFITFRVNGAITGRNTLARFPTPFSRTVELGPLVLGPSELSILVIAPLATLLIAAFFRLTSFGVAVRATAENGDSARLVGVPTKRVSTFVWGIAGLLSATTALLLSPGKGLTVSESLGPDLLVRALAAAVLARMTSLPKAVAAGVVIGVIEKTVLWNYEVGEVELVLFVVVLGALLLQQRSKGRDTDASSWSLVEIVRPLAPRLAALPWVRPLGYVSVAIVLAAAAALPLVLSNSQTYLLTTVVAFAIAALSVTVLTGFAGQISLGQIAFFGIGAAVSYQLTYQLYVPFTLALVLSGLVGAACSIAIGIPALRVKGLFLTVSTLGFALVVRKWLLHQTFLAGSGVIATRPYVGPLDFAGQKAYYLLALGGLVFAVVLTRNVLRSGVGRNLLAIRDNEAQGSAFTVSPTRTKLYGFAAAGFLAAFAGAIYGHGIELFNEGSFEVADSLRLVAMTVIGGLGSIPGTIAGAFFVVGTDRLIPDFKLLTTSVGLLALLLYLPGGFGSIISGGRDRLVGFIAVRRGDLTAAEVQAAISGQDLVFEDHDADAALPESVHIYDAVDDHTKLVSA